MDRLRNALRGDGLAKDTIWSLVQEAGGILSLLVSFSLLGRHLGIEGYGHYASLYAISAPLGTLAVSGVTLTLLQHVVQQEEDLEDTARSCLTMTLVIGIALTVVGTAIAAFVVQGLAIAAIVAVLLLEFVSVPSVNIAAGVLQIRDGYAASARLRLVPLLARIAIIVVLALTGKLSILALGATYLVVSAVIAVIALRRVGHRFGIRIVPSTIKRRLLRSSAIYSAGISGLSLQNDGDKAVLAAYRYQADTGLYSAAYRVVQLGLIPVGSIIAVTHVKFLEHEPGRKRQQLRKSLRYGAVCVAYGLVFALAIELAGPLLPLLLGDSFEGSVSMTRWIAPLVPLRALASFPLNGLMGLGRTFARTVLLLSSAVLSMVLYIVLIPEMQWKGAAVGTIIGEAALALAAWSLLFVYEGRQDAVVQPQSLLDELADLEELETPPFHG